MRSARMYIARRLVASRISTHLAWYMRQLQASLLQRIGLVRCSTAGCKLQSPLVDGTESFISRRSAPPGRRSRRYILMTYLLSSVYEIELHTKTSGIHSMLSLIFVFRGSLTPEDSGSYKCRTASPTTSNFDAQDVLRLCQYTRKEIYWERYGSLFCPVGGSVSS